MPTAKVVITKEFTFRNLPERFSNGYTFQTGSTGVDEADMAAAAAQLIAMERQFHASTVRFVYALGGMLGENATYVEEFATPLAGAANPGSGHQEVCVLAESKFGQRRYMRKWYHCNVTAAAGSGNQADVLDGTFRTTVETALQLLTNGQMPQGWRYCRPNGALATEPFTCDQFLRTHQLKARGKRPTPASG